MRWKLWQQKKRKIETESQMSTIDVPMCRLKNPCIIRRNRCVKGSQLLPGVQSGGEGQSGLYVRGGSPDQNLILLDGVPVYNVNHLFGFSQYLMPMQSRMSPSSKVDFLLDTVADYPSVLGNKSQRRSSAEDTWRRIYWLGGI